MPFQIFGYANEQWRSAPGASFFVEFVLVASEDWDPPTVTFSLEHTEDWTPQTVTFTSEHLETWES